MSFVAMTFMAIAAWTASCGSMASHPSLPTPALGDYSPAVRAQLQSALARAQANPDDAPIVGDLGRVFYAYGLHDPAAQAFARAGSIAPKSFRWVYLQGVALSDQGRFPEAEEALRQAAQLRPDDLPTALRLADLLEGSGDDAQALEILEALNSPIPAGVSYRIGRLYTSRDLATSAAHLEQALQLEPDYREALNLLANVYSQAGRVEDAGKQLGLFQQAAAKKRRHYADPLIDELDELKAGDVLTLFDDGLALQNAGDLRQALARYNEVLEIDPDYERAHVSLIAVHAMLGAPQQAVLHFERALAINPNLKEAHYNLGLMRHREGNFAAAAEAFSKALEINPTDAETLGSLGVALEQLGRGSTADEHFRSALRHDPANPTANFHLGRRLAERGRHREALPYLRRALETKAEPPPVQVFFLALVYRQLGNQEQAREYGQRALEQARSTGQTELAAQITAQLDL